MIAPVIERELVTYLRRHLGARLVAFLTATPRPSRVRQWARGARPMGVVTARQLLLAYRATRTLELAGKDDADIRAWFKGRSPRLDHLSPAEVIRDSDPMDVAQRILHAARSFAHFR